MMSDTAFPLNPTEDKNNTGVRDGTGRDESENEKRGAKKTRNNELAHPE
jgi:hypothetical protein